MNNFSKVVSLVTRYQVLVYTYRHCGDHGTALNSSTRVVACSGPPLVGHLVHVSITPPPGTNVSSHRFCYSPTSCVFTCSTCTTPYNTPSSDELSSKDDPGNGEKLKRQKMRPWENVSTRFFQSHRCRCVYPSPLHRRKSARKIIPGRVLI